MIITLKEWAEKVGIDPATARQKTLRGAIPARKLGHQWIIEEEMPNTDHRTKESKSKS